MSRVDNRIVPAVNVPGDDGFGTACASFGMTRIEEYRAREKLMRLADERMCEHQRSHNNPVSLP
jgi:hypothetical protein